MLIVLMALFSNLFLYAPINFIILLAPLIYVSNIRSFHRFCETNFSQNVTQIIKTFTPVPGEFTVSTIVLSYSFLFTMLLAETFLSLVIMILSWLF